MESCLGDPDRQRINSLALELKRAIEECYDVIHCIFARKCQTEMTHLDHKEVQN